MAVLGNDPSRSRVDRMSLHSQLMRAAVAGGVSAAVMQGCGLSERPADSPVRQEQVASARDHRLPSNVGESSAAQRELVGAASNVTTIVDSLYQFAFDVPTDVVIRRYETPDPDTAIVRLYTVDRPFVFLEIPDSEATASIEIRRAPLRLNCLALGAFYTGYDRKAFDEALPGIGARVIAALEEPTPKTLCGLMARQRHLDVEGPAFADLSEEDRRALVGFDTQANWQIKIMRCEVDGAVVVFTKERALAETAPELLAYDYGAVRFLHGRFASIAFVGVALDKPPSHVVDRMGEVVRSYREIGE